MKEEEKKINITVIYQRTDNDKWNAWVQFYPDGTAVSLRRTDLPEIRVEQAKTLVEAKVFIDILANEQLENFQVVKEIINYERD